jgi:hypothetical protein
MRGVVVGGTTFYAVMRIVIVVAIGEEVRWFRSLFMVLRRRSLGLLFVVILEGLILSLLPLSLVRLPPVQWPWVAIGAEMVEVFARGLLNMARIETFDMLPGIA